MKKFYSVILSLLIFFSMTGSSLAVQVIPGYAGLDLDSYDGVKWTNPNATTVDFTLDSGINTGILNWKIFNLQNGYTVNFGTGTFVNNVKGITNINGTINGLNANVYFNAHGGAIIGQNAYINVNSLLISTLKNTETNIAALRAKMETDKLVELGADNPSGPIRYGILIEDGAKITVANRIDFASSYYVNNHTNQAQLSNPVYSTTDGITFTLTADGAVNSIASSTPVPGGKMVPINKHLYYTPYPITPPTTVPPTSPDKLLPLDRLQEMKELTPTSANLDITNNIPMNLAGTQMRVIPLEDTRIVNNLPGSFDRGTIGAIALNNSTDRILSEENMIAVSDFTPIGAASQVGNTDGLEIENFDFIIPQAIVE